MSKPGVMSSAMMELGAVFVSSLGTQTMKTCNQCKKEIKNLYKMSEHYYCGDCLVASLVYASGVIESLREELGQANFERGVWISRYRRLEEVGLAKLFSKDAEDGLTDLDKN